MFRSNTGCKLKRLLISLIVALLCVSCLSYYFPISWLIESPEIIQVHVPAGYEGQVLLAYQVPNGRQAKKTGDTWIYQLQPDGAILLQDDPPSGIVSISFWYVKADGQLESIPNDTCFDDSKTEGAVVCTGMIADIFNEVKLRPNQSFYVGHLTNKRKLKNVDYDVLLRLYLEQLALPDNP